MQTNKIFTVILIAELFICTSGTAQNTAFPAGTYMSFEELKFKNPSCNLNVKFNKRPDDGINYNWGNDYIIYSPKDSIEGKILYRKIWAHSDGQNLYLNGYKFHFGSLYSKAETEGRYLAFYGTQSGGKTSLTSTVPCAFWNFNRRFIYIIDLVEGTIQRIDRKTIVPYLSEYPDLVEEFNREEDQKSNSVLLSYITRLNEKFGNPPDKGLRAHMRP